MILYARNDNREWIDLIIIGFIASIFSIYLIIGTKYWYGVIIIWALMGFIIINFNIQSVKIERTSNGIVIIQEKSLFGLKETKIEPSEIKQFMYGLKGRTLCILMKNDKMICLGTWYKATREIQNLLESYMVA